MSLSLLASPRCQLLRNSSFMDILAQRGALYRAVLTLMLTLARHPLYVGVLNPAEPLKAGKLPVSSEAQLGGQEEGDPWTSQQQYLI